MAPTQTGALRPLCETHTLTESRGEVTDADREMTVFSETHTVTKTNNETSDEDQSTWAAGQWLHGNRRPLLFQRAMKIAGEAPTFRYDRILAVSVDEDGQPVIGNPVLSETGTHTATRTEVDDADR